MTADLSIILEHRPGTLADACEAIGRAGINIEGVCGFASQGLGILHVAVEDAVGARRAVEGIGMKVSEQRDVIVANVEDRPGAAGRLLRRMGNAGVNPDLVYLATSTRVVIGASDLEKARGVV